MVDNGNEPVAGGLQKRAIKLSDHGTEFPKH